ncbi:MAG TPA: LysM peptidoglycan-binding domain-containing protein [Verrucomicrobium sp.]|nr:LysM peptidoglycan-binding domain-containing protein [Verrucomicrobium sp.]
MPAPRMNFRAFAALLLTMLPALWLSSCSSSPKIKGIPSKLPTISVNGIVKTPPHSMPTYEYPFDSGGRYVSEWAAEGEKRSGRAAAATNEDQEKWTGSHEGKPTGRQIVLKTTPPKSSSSSSSSKTKSKPTVKTVTKSSGSSTSKPKSSTTAKADSTGSKSKPKASSSAGSGGSSSYVVKKGDTLSSIARRNNTTVSKIKAANGMSSDFLNVGKGLKIPK